MIGSGRREARAMNCGLELEGGGRRSSGRRQLTGPSAEPRPGALCEAKKGGARRRVVVVAGRSGRAQRFRFRVVWLR
jgi:hypothetical protein